jgi:hypothetical protein
MLQVGQVRLPRQPGPRAVGLGQAVARDQRAAQVRHHLAEIQVAGGLGDQQVKAPVGFDAAVAGGGQVLIVVQRLAHLRQVPRAAQAASAAAWPSRPMRSSSRSRTLAALSAATRRPAWAWRSMTKVPMPWRGSTSPRPAAWTGFADHGAADAVLTHQGVFRRQFVAGFEGAQQDLLGQAGNQVVGAAVAAFARVFGFHV